MKYILVLLLMLSFAYADREGGPYIGVGYGQQKYNDDGLYTALKEKRSESLNFYAGAYMNKYFSVELDYVKIAPYTAVLKSKNVKLDLSIVTVSTLVHYPLYNDMFDTYIKFGVGDIREKNANAKGFTFVYGLGTSFRVSELISIKLSYDLYPFGYDQADATGTTNGISNYNQTIKYIYTAVEFQF